MSFLDFKKFGIVYGLVATVVIVFVITQTLPKEYVRENFKFGLNAKKATPSASLKTASASASPR